jgi:hypothetical protein
LWRVNNNFLNALHKMLLLTVDWLCTAWSHYHYSNMQLMQ